MERKREKKPHLDTFDLPSGYKWRYKKLEVIVYFVLLRPFMCTCISVASPTY